MNWPALSVFVLLFALVTVLGFVAARWRRGNLDRLNEWGLAGRRFGTVVTWFLLGGDLYTAYTFVAVPALVFGAGAIGFSRCRTPSWCIHSCTWYFPACGRWRTSTAM